METLTPQGRTQNLRVKPLLVFPNLGGVTLWPRVGGIHVDHWALTGRVLPYGFWSHSLTGESHWNTAQGTSFPKHFYILHICLPPHYMSSKPWISHQKEVCKKCMWREEADFRSSLPVRRCKQDGGSCLEVCACEPPRAPATGKQCKVVTACLLASPLLPLYLPTEVTVVPLDGEICSNLGSIKGVKEEEDLCFWSVLLADWVCNVNFDFINTNDTQKDEHLKKNILIHSTLHCSPAQSLVHRASLPRCCWNAMVAQRNPAHLTWKHRFLVGCSDKQPCCEPPTPPHTVLLGFFFFFSLFLKSNKKNS